VKIFTLDPFPTERIPFTVITSAPVEPKVTTPDPLKVRLLNVVLPPICPAAPLRLTVPVPPGSDKPEAPLLFVQLLPTFSVLTPAKVSVAPELTVMVLQYFWIASPLMTGWVVAVELITTSVETVGSVPHDQLAGTFQSESTAGVPVVPPSQVPAIH